MDRLHGRTDRRQHNADPERLKPLASAAVRKARTVSVRKQEGCRAARAEYNKRRARWIKPRGHHRYESEPRRRHHETARERGAPERAIHEDARAAREERRALAFSVRFLVAKVVGENDGSVVHDSPKKRQRNAYGLDRMTVASPLEGPDEDVRREISLGKGTQCSNPRAQLRQSPRGPRPVATARAIHGTSIYRTTREKAWRAATREVAAFETSKDRHVQGARPFPRQPARH